MPASYSDSLRFISGSRISAAMPGANLPTDPERLDGCTCSGPFRFRIWQIDADHGRSLGETVAFEDFLLKAFFKMVGQIERQLFGAGDNEAQTSELFRLGLTQIQPQECGRQKQKGKLMAFDQRRAVCRVEWIRICHDAHTFNKRIPKCDR